MKNTRKKMKKQENEKIEKKQIRKKNNEKA